MMASVYFSIPAARSGRAVLLAGLALAALHPTGARAQAVDYGTLESMFGEPITTSVTGKPQRASEVPGDLTIITQDDIRRSGATSIPEILQFVTGIDVRNYSFGDAQVGIRGYDAPLNPRLLVLVDGRQVYLDDYGYVAWNTIPVQMGEIRQIEVVKGPASALFGFNAASGVINIVTYDPLLDKVNTATIRGGTQGYGAGEAVATVHMGTTAGVRVSVGGWVTSGYENQAGTLDAQSPRYASVNADGRWQVTPNILLSLSGGSTDSRTLRYFPEESFAYSQDQLSYFRIGAAYQSSLGTITADFYRNEGLLNLGFDGKADNNVYVAKLFDLFKLNADNTFRVGFEYRNNSVSSDPLYGGDVSYSNYALSGMWDWQISPMFELTNAVRVEHLVLGYSGTLVATSERSLALYNNTTLTEESFNSGLVIKVTDQDTVRLTASRGLQVPSLIDFGIQLVTQGADLLGTPSVAPTAVWNGELAYDRSLPSIGATLQTALYFQRNTDLLSSPGNTPYRYDSGVVVSDAANVGSSNEIGVEIGLRGKTSGGFRWNLSYRYASITDDASSAYPANPTNKFSGGTPRDTVIAGIGYTIGPWEMDASGRWQSSYQDFTPLAAGGVAPFIVGNYVTFNARLGYRVTSYLTLAGTAEQFNESRLVVSSGDVVNRRLIASATVKF